MLHVTGLAVVVLLLLLVDVGAFAPGPAARPHQGSGVANPGATGAARVAAARASLATGAGPSLAPLGPAGNASSPAAWLPIAPANSTTPAQRYLGMLAYDPVDQYVVLFGGANSTIYATTSMSDTWTFAHGIWTEIFPTNSPQPRYLGVMSWDAKDGYLVMFGGYDYSSSPYTYAFLNDTWTFLHGQWTNVTSSSTQVPSQRWRPNMAYDAVDGYVLMFGGTESNGVGLADTWTYSGGVWTNITKNVTGNPPGRYRSAMTYDEADGYVLLFGGCTSTASSCATSDSWKYTNLTWTHLAPTTHPSARVYTAMDFDEAKGYVVLYGGSSQVSSPSNMMTDTWSFLNGSWTNLTSKITAHPSGRGFQMMAFDPLDNYSILFGGWNANTNVYLGDTWSYGPSLIASLAPMATTIDQGQTTTFNVTAISNSSALNYTYNGLPAGCASVNASQLNCTPTVTGTFPVEVVVSTPFNVSTTVNVSLTVNVDPSVASFSVTPSATTAGGTVVFSTIATAGTVPYSYQYASLPIGCSSRDVWNLTCRPSTAGSYSIEMEVVDATGFGTFANVSLTVNVKPSVTTFTAFPLVLDIGQQTNLTVVAHGGTGTLTYNYTGLPSGCFSSNVPRLTCQPASSGTFEAFVQVTDTVGFLATAALNLSVGIGPSITAFVVSPSTIDSGQAVTFWLNASAGTGALNYSYASNLAGCAFPHQSQVTCSPTGTGSFTITGSVTDSVGMTVRATVTLLINPTPSVTTVTSTPSVLDVGQNVTIDVAVAGGTLPYAYVYTGLPAGCSTVDAANVTCTPKFAGSPAVTVEVTDHQGRTARGTVLLTVNAAPSVSHFTANPTTVAPGTVAVLTVTAVGGSGVYTYAYTGLPSSCSSANTSSLRCTPSATGTFHVTVTITDSLGSTAQGRSNLTVENPASTNGSFLGSSNLTYVIIGVVALVVVIAAVVLLLRRRGGPGAPSAPSEDDAAEAAPYETSEPTGE